MVLILFIKKPRQSAGLLLFHHPRPASGGLQGGATQNAAPDAWARNHRAETSNQGTEINC
jgi:hypothetical protein